MILKTIIAACVAVVGLSIAATPSGATPSGSDVPCATVDALSNVTGSYGRVEQLAIKQTADLIALANAQGSVPVVKQLKAARTTTARKTAVQSAKSWCTGSTAAGSSTPTNGGPNAKTSGGITVVVQHVSQADHLTYASAVNEHNVGDVVPAGPGATYVIVQTQLTNNSSGGIDLTCSAPVTTKLIDAAGRSYDRIDTDLAELLPNQPACNASTNPGFTVPMAWAYKVPTGTLIKFFQFQDTTDFNKEQAPARVPVTVQ